MKTTLKIFFCMLTVFFAFPQAQGQSLVVKKFGLRDSMQSYPEQSVVASIVHQGKVIASSVSRSDEKVRLIVELKAPSNLEQRNSLRSDRPASMQSMEFSAALAKSVPTLQVEYRFTEAVNALTVTVDKIDIEKIVSLSEVRGVFIDHPVRASVLYEPTASAAPGDVTSSSATGKGVRVGILDTGIDYNHESLGKGFGTGFTIAGGYDCINNDSDPMDDNGHGTHVAGIIAGRSASLAGWSPNAEIYAYKVLDASGNGYQSDIIAGMERAIKDSVKVINLSLGSTSGDPFDPLSKVVDRAVEAGIVVVVAAGNAGTTGSIGSPGAAAKALTVGAIDAKNLIASFSSKGPTNRAYNIKPDVVAPGVSIVSAKRGGGYVAMSGTSMAAPYVAGIAAMLREIYPEWSAIDVRNAIIGSAQDIRESVFSQGNGRIDTLQVFRKQLVADPPAISFGFDYGIEATYSKKENLRLTNHSTVLKSFTVTASSPKSGVMVTASPAKVDVAPGQSAAVEISLTVENGSVPDNSSLFNGYTGKVYAVSGSDSLTIPYAFFKGPLLQCIFSEVPLQVLIHNRKDKAYTFSPTDASVSALLPNGVYDVVASFAGSAYVVREGIDTRVSREVTMNRSDAVNTVTITPSDETGKTLLPVSSNNTYSYVEAIVHPLSGMSQAILGGGAIRTSSLIQKKFFSRMSSAYSFGYALNVQYGTAKSYTYDIAIDTGISMSRPVTFAPADLKHVDFKYDVDSTVSRIFPITWTTFVQGSNILGVAYYNSNDTPLRYPFIQSTFYSKRTSLRFPIMHYREAYKY